MLLFLKQNIATVVISLILILIVAAIIVNIIRKKKKGKSLCGCNCSSCALSESCHKS